MMNEKKKYIDIDSVVGNLDEVTVKDLRKQAGMSRKDFCNSFEIPYRTLQSWELGEREMSDFSKRLLAYVIITSELVENYKRDLEKQVEGERDGEKKNNTELDLDEDGIPKLEYIQVGKFLLPNLSLEKVDGYIGRWGIMRKEDLQKHKPAVYSSMLLMDELNQHLIDIQKTADERMDVLEKQLLERDPAPDKAKDGMAWTRHMNQIRHQAEEYVKSEIIFN